MMEERSVFPPKPRIQSLSDLIFGLALSIGALTLIGQQPTTSQQVLYSLGLYGFSFLILISVWRAYSTVISVLPVETAGLIHLNIVLLFLVSIEPYLFNQVIVFTNENWDAVSMFFALDLGFMFLILAFFNHSLTDEERKLVPASYLRRFRISRNVYLLTAAIIIVSIAPIFYSTIAIHLPIGDVGKDIPIRAILWIITLPLNWARSLLVASSSKDQRDPSVPK